MSGPYPCATNFIGSHSISPGTHWQLGTWRQAGVRLWRCWLPLWPMATTSGWRTPFCSCHGWSCWSRGRVLPCSTAAMRSNRPKRCTTLSGVAKRWSFEGAPPTFWGKWIWPRRVRASVLSCMPVMAMGGLWLSRTTIWQLLQPGDFSTMLLMIYSVSQWLCPGTLVCLGSAFIHWSIRSTLRSFFFVSKRIGLRALTSSLAQLPGCTRWLKNVSVSF